jgi:hypothetical protein
MGFFKKIYQKTVSNPAKKIFGGEGESGLLGTGYTSPSVDPFYANEAKNVAGLLKKRITGEAPSIAEASTTAALNRNLRDQQTGIRSIGGISGQLKQRMLSRASADAGADIAEKGGMMRLQEQMGAEKSLADLLSGQQQRNTELEQLRIGAFENKANRRQNLLKAVGEGIAGAKKG